MLSTARANVKGSYIKTLKQGKDRVGDSVSISQRDKVVGPRGATRDQKDITNPLLTPHGAHEFSSPPKRSKSYGHSRCNGASMQRSLPSGPLSMTYNGIVRGSYLALTLTDSSQEQAIILLERFMSYHVSDAAPPPRISSR